MPLWVPWILFLLPAAALTIAWHKLMRNWRSEPHSIAGLSCLVLASASTLLALGSLAWVQFVRPFPSQGYSVERWGMLLSLPGLLSGFFVRHKHLHRYLGLGAAAAGWMLTVFTLMASAI
jgi:hypothetical protein